MCLFFPFSSSTSFCFDDGVVDSTIDHPFLPSLLALSSRDDASLRPGNGEAEKDWSAHCVFVVQISNKQLVGAERDVGRCFDGD
uniref:Secreted protein n=1 Tax=Panagrellus redivivus TaxID=6233 RepID=A0A7E4VRW3_PANRE